MKIDTNFSTIYISSETDKILQKIFTDHEYSKIFVLVDENTKAHCLPRISEIDVIKNSVIIEIESGEKNKNIESVKHVWEMLTQNGADRSSLLINLGGGIIGDSGGFAASTFKRGMDFINIPTTLLSQVDASIGGKTGINFLNLKNEIGVFSHPKYVIIDSSFNRTLDKRNILSGWAEMLKHALLFNEKDWDNLIGHDIKHSGFKALNQQIARSVTIKDYFIKSDSNEKGSRKSLNFGHTFGHAFESLFMDTEYELLHGEAIAQGMICELYLSNKICNFPIGKVHTIIAYLKDSFGKIKIENNQFEPIYQLITHDKKNEGLNINFTLLEDFGEIKINQNCTKEDIIDTLTWYINI